MDAREWEIWQEIVEFTKTKCPENLDAKGTKNDAKRELKWRYFQWHVKFSKNMSICVSTAQARADRGSGHSFNVFSLSLSPFSFSFVFLCFLAPLGTFEIEACRRFGTKKLVGERLQKNTKKTIRKVRTYSEKVIEKEVPKNSLFVIFWLCFLWRSKVASTRFRGHFDLFVFYVLEKDGRNNCKMLPKLEVKWIHENVKCDKKS